MKHVRVHTLQPFTWGGQSYAAGDTLIVPVVEALRLKRQRLITTTKHAPTPPADPAPVGSASIVDASIAHDEPTSDTPPPEQPAPDPPSSDPPSPEPDDTPRRRKYKRRDLESER